jgi:hypothetical protein
MSNLLALGFPTISKTGTSAEDVVEYSLYDFLQGSLSQSQVNQAEKNRQSEMRKVVVPEPEEFDFSKVGVDAKVNTHESETFKAPAISSDKQGFLSNGIYRLDAKAMKPHIDGNNFTGKSQFKYGVNADKAVLDGAAYANEKNLWLGNKAKVFIVDGIVGYSNGQPTQWLNIYRTSTGMVHDCPTTTAK